MNTNDDICSEVRLFLLGVIILFMELNDLSHSDEDMAIVEIVVKSGLKATIEESFVSLNSRNPRIVDFSFN